MEFLFKLLGEQWFIGMVQLGLGKAVKESPISNRLIPAANFLLAVLLGLNLPATAHAASLLGGAVGEGAGVFGLALLQTVMVTGTHSTFKNSVLPALKMLVFWAADKLKK